MPIQTAEEVEAIAALQNIKAQQQLERKIALLYCVPGVCFFILLVAFGTIEMLGMELQPLSIAFLLLINIMAVGQAVMKRMDAMRDLDSLKRNM